MALSPVIIDRSVRAGSPVCLRPRRGANGWGSRDRGPSRAGSCVLALACAGSTALAADDSSNPAPAELPAIDGLAPEDLESDAATLRDTAERDPRALGPLSIGTPDAGLLLNPVLFPAGSYWTLREPGRGVGHRRDDRLHRERHRSGRGALPGLAAPRDRRPQQSARRPHRPAPSHQAGRDADLGFYYRSGESPTRSGRHGRRTSTRRAPGPSCGR